MNDLLICAKVLGYSAEAVGDEVWLYHCNVDTSTNPAPGSNIKILSTVWEPDKCDAQAMELLKWLLQRGWVIFKPTPPAYKTEFEYALAHQDHGEIQTYTLNEAIIKAVVAMEDTHE